MSIFIYHVYCCRKQSGMSSLGNNASLKVVGIISYIRCKEA